MSRVVLALVPCVLGCHELFSIETVEVPDATNGTDGGQPADAAVDGYVNVGANVMFVTSATWSVAQLGGLAGADQKCQDLASAAGLPGTFTAWLSDSSATALGRMGLARGWVRPDGKPFTDTLADLVAGRIWYPPRIDETGTDLGRVQVITATRETGLRANDCNSLTGTGGSVLTGNSATTRHKWTDDQNTIACDVPAHLYCFQTDGRTQVSVSPLAGRTAFLSTTQWVPGGGVATADEICAGEAQTAALSGSYLALLSTTQLSAASRFSSTGDTWVRPDGVPLAPTAAAVLSGKLDTPLNVDLGGAYHTDEHVWTGSTAVNVLGNDATSCTDWTVNSGNGRLGVTVYSDGSWFSHLALGCGNARSVYCLQQ